jgi:hypothetical protein
LSRYSRRSFVDFGAAKPAPPEREMSIPGVAFVVHVIVDDKGMRFSEPRASDGHETGGSVPRRPMRARKP